MYLLEIELDKVRNHDLDYLSEYLIERKGITVSEAKEFIVLIEEEKQAVLKRLREWYSKKLSALKDWYQKKVTKVRQMTSKPANVIRHLLSELKNSYKMKKYQLLKEYAAKKEKEIGRLKGMVRNVKVSLKAAGHAVKNTGKMASVQYPKLTKAGKYGAGAAAVGGAAALAYKASKNKK